jgi:H+/Cl- antiporter ClcA
MSNNELSTTTNSQTQTYVLGAVLGAIAGLLAAVLYARANEEERLAGGQPQKLQTGQMITLGLALLGIIRQIAEMGRPDTKKGRR